MIAVLEKSGIDKIKSQVVCPVELSLRILGGKWRGSILYQLKDGPLRFNELKFRVEDAIVEYDETYSFLSNKVLSEHLNNLIEFGLLSKELFDSHFYYKLTGKGEEVMPILIDLFYWGDNNF